MSADREILDAQTTTPGHPQDPIPTSSRPPIATTPDLDEPGFGVEIERDLAVQMVGSDAGRARRMKPHRATTADASPQQLADVMAVMEPFLLDEIRRVYEDKKHRTDDFRGAGQSPASRLARGVLPAIRGCARTPHRQPPGRRQASPHPAAARPGSPRHRPDQCRARAPAG